MKKDRVKINIDAPNLKIENPIYVKGDKSIYVDLGAAFNQKTTNFNQFTVSKSAYINNIENICRYSNIFFQDYDADNEFLSGMLSLKLLIDTKNIEYSESQFISDIIEYILTDSVVDKIFEMVEDYWSCDLEKGNDNKEVNFHALQFNNAHGKAIMALSIADKLTIPLVCHYHATVVNYLVKYGFLKPPLNDADIKFFQEVIEKENLNLELADLRYATKYDIKKFLNRVFCSYFPIFSKGFDLYNKFLLTADNHLTGTRTSEKVMWSRAENKKVTPTIWLNKLLPVITVDLVPKAIFGSNIITLIQVSIPRQIKTILTAKDAYDYSDISMTSKSDELSGLEKMETNNAKVSDLDVVISKENIKEGIRKIKKKFKIKIEDDEIKYYKKNLNTFGFSELILQFFAKYFGGIYDLKSISKKDYLTLVIIFKKVMGDMGFVYLHQIMTGNISSSIKKRRVSSKQLRKIEDSPKFKKVMRNYSMGMEPINNTTIRVIAELLNTPIEYVDYHHPEYLDRPILADADILADEYLRFIKLL